MKTKLFSLILTLWASTGLLFAQSGTCMDGLTWTLSDGTLTISATYDKAKMLDFNDGYYEYGSHTAPWFDYRSSIKNVVINSGVPNIGTFAFYGYGNLQSVTIGKDVKSIGNYAFKDCSSLTSVTLYSNAIVSKSYDSSSNLDEIFGKTVTKYIIGDDVTSIGDWAFAYIPLTSITIPNSVKSIGNNAFKGCTSLTSVTIGNNVKSIGQYAFCNCTGLKSITIPNSVKFIEQNAFNGCTGLITEVDNLRYMGSCLIGVVDKTLNTYNIKKETKIICSNVFYGCKGLKSITIPRNVTSIGKYAFYGCDSLNAVHISDIAAWCAISFGDGISNPLSYANNLYLNGKLVKDLTLPNSVTSIGYAAFFGCKGLISVTIPNSVTSIGGSAFSGCSSLTTVTIGNNVKSIGRYAFENCSSLNAVHISDIVAWSAISFGDQQANPLYYTHNLYLNGNGVKDYCLIIPNGATRIGDYAFYGFSGLISVTIPNSVTSIGGCAFADCTGLTSVTIGNSVTNIGNGAFSGCTGLTSITIPNSVTSIGMSTFYGCTGLISVTIPNSVTSIGNMAFYGCKGLISVTIPNSVTSIGYQAFYNCRSLTSITIPNSVTSIGDYAFLNCSSLTSVTLQSNAIVSKTSTSTDQLATIFGSQVTEYIIGDGVKSIGNYAFRNYINLTTITISNSVTSIGDCAFDGCTGLTSVTIGNSVTSIGEWAFADCTGLISVTIPKSVTSIGEGAFYGCTGLTAVHISDIAAWCAISFDPLYANKTSNPLSYANNLYFNGKLVNDLTIPNSVTNIGWRAFCSCRSLTSITIPNSVTSIGYWAFENCSSLASVTCEAVNPPALDRNVFDSVPCGEIPLYVPEESLAAYQAADQWKEFNPILPIVPQETTYTVRFVDWNGTILKEESVVEGTSATAPVDPVYADHIFMGWDKDFSVVHSDMTITAVYRPDLGPDATETNTTKVVITPIENEGVIVEWPAMENATSFTIEIKKDGKIIYTFTFNEKGQLISVTPAAPSRFGERMQSTGTQAAQGWKYTIMGLEADEEYTCTVTIKNGNNVTLLSQTISFSTVSVTGIEEIETEKVQGTKFIHNGQLYLLRDGKVYNAVGAEVK